MTTQKALKPKQYYADLLAHFLDIFFHLFFIDFRKLCKFMFFHNLWIRSRKIEFRVKFNTQLALNVHMYMYIPFIYFNNSIIRHTPAEIIPPP